MNRNDVIDVLTAVAAATRRTIGEADVEIWQGVIGGDDRELALKAVRDHLRDCPGVWLEPGHVHQRVRASVRDRLERESDAEREGRQKTLAAKVLEDEVAELAAHKALPGPEYTRPVVNALTVTCPWCAATSGMRCRVLSTEVPMRQFHPSRVELAKRVTV